MLAAVPETAKKLSERVINSKEPVAFRLEDVKDMKSVTGITTNDFATLRRSIVFASDQPIISEMTRGRGRTMAYRKVSSEEFKQYQFNERNFTMLKGQDISNIRRRVQKVDPDYNKRDLLRLMTICDIVLQGGGRDHYVETAPKFIACAILKDEAESTEMIKFLVQIGVLSELNEKLRYNSYFADAVANKNPANIASEKRYEEQVGRKMQYLQDIEDAIDHLKEVVSTRHEAFKDWTTPEAEYKKEIQYLKEQLDQQKLKIDSFTMALKSYDELNKAYTDLKEKYNKMEERMEKYREDAKLNPDRIQNIMGDALQKAANSDEKYDQDYNAKTRNLRRSALFADTTQSIIQICCKKY